jgi:hypothetical protein
MESFSDLEVWDRPEFQYGMIPKDPKNPNGPKEQGSLVSRPTANIYLQRNETYVKY